LNVEDLDRAKKMTKLNVSQTLERSRSRLEDNLRSLLLYDKLLHNDYDQLIDRVSVESIKDLLSRLLASKPTLLVKGNPSSVPSYDKVANFFDR